MARSKQLQRLEPWHHDLIDSMLANPERSGREAAAHFGVSPVWISIVKNSEVFRVEFERRREALSQTVTADIADRVTMLAKLSLDVLKERIEQDRGSVSVREVRETAKLVLKMLGYGAPRNAGRGDGPASPDPDLGHPSKPGRRERSASPGSVLIGCSDNRPL